MSPSRTSRLSPRVGRRRCRVVGLASRRLGPRRSASDPARRGCRRRCHSRVGVPLGSLTGCVAAGRPGRGGSAPLLRLGGPLGRRPLAARTVRALAGPRRRAAGRAAGAVAASAWRSASSSSGSPSAGRPSFSRTGRWPGLGARVLPSSPTGFDRLLGRRVEPDDVGLLAEGPQVAREPVEQHAEREVEQQSRGQHADRDDVEHQPLDGGRGALGRRRWRWPAPAAGWRTSPPR